MTHPLRPRLPATQAARLDRILTSAGSHLSHLSDLGTRLHEDAAWHPGGLETSLLALHEAATSLDPEAPPPAGRETAAPIRAGLQRVLGEAGAVMQRSEGGAARLQPVLPEFFEEFRAVERVVDRAGEWIAELQSMIAAEAGGVQGDPGWNARADMVDRAEDLRSRFALLEAVSRSARNVHALADSLLKTRPALEETVQGPLQRACLALAVQLEQPGAALQGPRSDVQIWAAQALSLTLRLQSCQDRLGREAGALRHRCSLLPRPEHDVDTVALNVKRLRPQGASLQA